MAGHEHLSCFYGRSSNPPSFMHVRAGPWQQKSRQRSKPLRWDAIGDFWIFPTKTMWRTRRFATECNWSIWWSPNHGKETETQMVWPHLKILWHSEDNSAGDSERSKKERKTVEEMGKWHQGMDGNGIWRIPEGSGRQGRMERYCCNVTCGSPTTSAVKGLRWEEMKH